MMVYKEMCKITSMNTGTPEEIAEILFSSEPSAPRSIKLISDDDINDYCYGFEILSTILFEGFEILTDGLDKVKKNEIEDAHFEIIQPWINSLGFNVNYYKLDNSELDNTHYCRVVFNNGSDKGYFNMKNIDKNYSFIRNANFNTNEDHTQDEYTCLLHGDKESYLIYFVPL